MLTELRIRSFAIIDSVTLPLERGLNVLSGETGAGKSIIVGALGLLLGERASADLVRPGADRATVEGVFELEGRSDLLAMVDARGIETEGDTLVLKREIAATGRGRAWINGTPVTATVLAEVGRTLVNLHGQHEAQTLLDAESQRIILDAYAEAGEVGREVVGLYGELVDIRSRITELTRRRAEAERRADYLRHVAAEIADARLSPNEDVQLEDDARVLENADELRTLAESVAVLLSDDEAGALARLASAHRALGQIARIDTSAARMQELYDTGYYALEELSRAASEYAGSVELDPDRLAGVRQRRELIFRLSKKYGGTLADVIAAGAQAQSELDLVDSAEFDVAQMRRQEADAADRLKTAASRLSALRKRAATAIGKAVSAELPELGMESGRFSVVLAERAEISQQGAEDVEFRVALNVGYDPRPLARVASGGELARVMLALKTVLATVDHVPTLVFDEVDAGIGGRVGLQVGDTMRRVAEQHQVFAISHLPQIAARAHHHIVVAKGARGGVTTADITVLSSNDRVSEIARMLGGDPESKASRAHARELLQAAAG
ncbi:MAG: DNA repair protein RecN [Gemmatimonadota bacterium]|nr:DNA repair protein RecN [Gemmatimonadota bacterium]